jgi:ribosome-associated heat shock protein Hsp15
VEQVRIDRWLWAARFFKTRGSANEAVVGGHVQVNGVRVKPAKEIRIGDTVEVVTSQIRRTVVVEGIADRRGSATVAATLYDETPESIADREQQARERREARPLGSDLGLRPTKQDRRRIDALRRSQKDRRTGR